MAILYSRGERSTCFVVIVLLIFLCFFFSSETSLSSLVLSFILVASARFLRLVNLVNTLPRP